VTVVTVVLVVILGAWMGLRGYHRGAWAIVVGWMPVMLLITTACLAVFYRWTESGSFKAKLSTIAAAALLLFIVGSGLFRSLRKRRDRGQQSEPVAETWLSRTNRLVGAFLGLICCMYSCLALSLVSGSVVFRVTMNREQEKTLTGAEPDPPPKWVDSLKTVSNTLAGVGDAGLLRHIPRAREYSREIRALVTILNSPGEKLRGVGEKRDLRSYAEIPEVKAALLDKEYKALVLRVQAGDLMALDSIARSPLTKALLDCPEIRELTRSLKPSDLVRDMEELFPPEDEGEAEEVEDAAFDQAALRESRLVDGRR